MSTSGSLAGKIMVAASCCSSWHDYVAGAVMTYIPNKAKDPNIGGTIKLPENMRCEAFSLSNGRKMPPCKSCRTLFSLPMTNTLNDDSTSEQGYPIGNCAEVESLSNLFKGQRKDKKKIEVQPASESWENDEKILKNVEPYLNSLLNLEEVKKVFKWDKTFYSP